MHALCPAFRELGLAAAAIYEALETSNGPMSSFDAAQIAGIGRSAVFEALETLAAWNLVRPDGCGRWHVVATTCLGRLAEAWGVTDAIRQRVARHRAEKVAYRRALRIPDDLFPDLVLAGWLASSGGQSSSGFCPPDPLATALELLQRELNAQILVST